MTRDAHRVALVTGATRRIGAGIAIALAQAGHALVLHTSARARGETDALAEVLRASGASVACVSGDLADVTATGALIDTAGAAFGALDLLVNNASLFEEDAIAHFDAAMFDRHIAINLRAPLLLAQGFARQARADGDPSIVNILDQRVLAPDPRFLSYTLSKAALATATTTLAQALAPTIRVNGVAPGPVLPNVHDGADRFAAEVAQVPLARAVPVEAVAQAVLYLAHANTVTGQIIAVDSGQRLAWRTPDVLAGMDA